jgi:predicted Fe-Mo cluster-binding NifX family protein
MKAAMAVRGGRDPDAAVDPHFGRAERFLVLDVESGEVLEALDNEAAAAEHGAGTGAGALMGRLGVEAVVAGRFGPKAAEVLSRLGIAMYEAGDAATARDAVAALRAGTLQRFALKTY